MGKLTKLDESDSTVAGTSSAVRSTAPTASTSVSAGSSQSYSGTSANMLSDSIMMGMNTDFKCNIGSELFLSSCSAAAMLRNRGNGKNAPKCELDAQGCLSLGNILESFSAAINEEHAWAICFLFAKTGQSVLSDPECKKACHLVSKTEHVKLHKDGDVHEETFLPHSATADRPPGKGICLTIYLAIFLNY